MRLGVPVEDSVEDTDNELRVAPTADGGVVTMGDCRT